MVNCVFDTNILIDYLSGIEKARRLIEKEQSRFISVISQIEIMVGAQDQGEQAALELFLAHFERIDVDQDLADLAVSVRKDYNLKIPDAIIYASAVSREAIFFTRNTKDFSTGMPFVTIPYKL